MDILAGSSAARPTVAAVDRATRRVFVHIYRNQTKATSTDFLRRLQNAAPMRISRILTDRFTSKARSASLVVIG